MVIVKKTFQEKGEITDFRHEWHTKHDDVIYVLKEALALKKNKIGKTIRYNGTLLKKTAKRIAEIALEKAKGLNRLQSDFFTSMSHKTRTMMNVTLGFANFQMSPNWACKQKKKFLGLIG